MPVRTKRWNDPRLPDDGLRVLITRYRPRGVPRQGEPWDAWSTALSPSKALHAAAYGKQGEAISFDEYERRFREEMETSKFWISGFAERVARGETITLLCSSACVDEARCHRTLIKAMIEDELRSPQPGSSAPVRKRPRR